MAFTYLDAWFLVGKLGKLISRYKTPLPPTNWCLFPFQMAHIRGFPNLNHITYYPTHLKSPPGQFIHKSLHLNVFGLFRPFWGSRFPKNCSAYLLGKTSQPTHPQPSHRVPGFVHWPATFGPVISPWMTGLFLVQETIITLPETNIAPENRSLEKEIPIGNHHF